MSHIWDDSFKALTFVQLAAVIPEAYPWELGQCVLACGHTREAFIAKEGEFVYHWRFLGELPLPRPWK